MKKIATTLFALGLLALASSAFAIPIYIEEFNYAAASQLNTQGGWAAHSAAGTNAVTISGGSLTYTGYPSSGIGNKAGTTATSGEDNNHTFTGQASGTVYASFLVNVVSSQANGDYFFHFFDGAVGGGVFRGRVFVKKDAASTNYAFGLQFGSAATNLVYTPFSYTPGSTHLLVLQYDFNAAATDDQVRLYIDPVVDCVEPNATLTTSDATQTDATNLDGLAIRQGSATAAPTVQVDGIRVGLTWADATCDQATPARKSSWGQVKTTYR